MLVRAGEIGLAGPPPRSRCCSASAGWAGTMSIWRAACGAGAERGPRAENGTEGWQNDGPLLLPSRLREGLGEGATDLHEPPHGAPAPPASGRERSRHLHRPRLPRSHRQAPRRQRGNLGVGGRSRVQARSHLAARPRRMARRRRDAKAWPRARASCPPRRSTSPTVESLFGDRIETRRSVRFDPATGAGTRRCASGGSARSACRAGRFQRQPEEIEPPCSKACAPRPGAAALERSGAAHCATARLVRGHGGSHEIDEAHLLARSRRMADPLLAGKRRSTRSIPAR
jgi:ATP-dependent helicase HrpB